MEYFPIVELNEPLAKHELNKEYVALLFDSVKSLGEVEYAFLLVVYDKGTRDAVYVVSSEVNALARMGGGSHYLGVFEQHGRSNLGSSDDWGDRDLFFPEAIRRVNLKFGTACTSIARGVGDGQARSQRMNSDTEELYEACAGGDVQNTKRALAKAPDVNSREWDSLFTPLHVCIAGQLHQPERQEIVRLLCKAGARLDLKDERGWSPLLFAAVRDRSLCAEALLQRGADVHAANEDGATSLHHAAFQGNVETAKVLLRFGADAAREDANGCTPPHLARSQGHAELEQLLLSPPKPSGRPWWRVWS